MRDQSTYCIFLTLELIPETHCFSQTLIGNWSHCQLCSCCLSFHQFPIFVLPAEVETCLPRQPNPAPQYNCPPRILSGGSGMISNSWLVEQFETVTPSPAARMGELPLALSLSIFMFFEYFFSLVDVGGGIYKRGSDSNWFDWIGSKWYLPNVNTYNFASSLNTSMSMEQKCQFLPKNVNIC